MKTPLAALRNAAARVAAGTAAGGAAGAALHTALPATAPPAFAWWRGPAPACCMHRGVPSYANIDGAPLPAR